MKQYLLVSENEQFIFLEVEEDKWMEEYWKKEVNEDGDVEWLHMHTTRFLGTSAVETFVSKLNECGFENY